MRTPVYILSAVILGGLLMSTIGDAQQRQTRDQATGNAFKAKPQPAAQPDPAKSPFEAEPEQPAVAAESTGAVFELGTPDGTLRLVVSCPIKTFKVTGDRGFTLTLTTDDLDLPLQLWTSNEGVCYSLFGATAVSDKLLLKDPTSGETLVEAQIE